LKDINQEYPSTLNPYLLNGLIKMAGTVPTAKELLYEVFHGE
jgi:hypothetical protein